jgi:hypothetical protein
VYIICIYIYNTVFLKKGTRSNMQERTKRELYTLETKVRVENRGLIHHILENMLKLHLARAMLKTNAEVT